MSEKQKQPLSRVLSVAQEIAGALDLGCVRVEIAGSLRRQKPDIGDIEIVALPLAPGCSHRRNLCTANNRSIPYQPPPATSAQGIHLSEQKPMRKYLMTEVA